MNYDLVLLIIRISELYGYEAYLNSDMNKCCSEDNTKYSDLLRRKLYKSSINDKVYYNSGQLSLLNDFDIYQKCFVSAPTSFGKTSLVLEYILKNKKIFKNIVIIVPTNALVEELYIKLLIINKNHNMNFNIMTNPKKSTENNLWILTPEKYLLLCEDFSIIVDLYVMDESYKIEDEVQIDYTDILNSRSSKYRKVMEIVASSKNKVIFLSPYTFIKDDSMIRFFKKHDIKIIDRKYNYVSKNLLDISTKSNFTKIFPNSNPTYRKEVSGIKKAIELIPYLKENTIIYVRYPSEALKIIEQIDTDYSKIINDNMRFKKFIDHLENTYQFDDSTWYIIDGLKKGIGVYVSPIPRYIKKEIVNLFNINLIKYLVVTTAFAEGVNSSAKNIILTNSVAGANNKMTPLDLLNLSGRAGRFGVYSQGNVFTTKEEITTILKESESSGVKIENPNYKILGTSEKRSDYDIDIIDENILNKEEIQKKNNIEKIQNNLNLLDSDLKIALSVSKKEKVVLYYYLSSIDNKDDINNIYISIRNLLSSDRKDVVNSIKKIFFELKKANINVTSGFGDIPPYNNKNDFVWGDFYAIHSSGNIKEILKSRKKYINYKLNDILKSENLVGLNFNEIKEILQRNHSLWISDYITDGRIDDFKLYNGAFKFISNIIEYRIPFYIGFFVSIFRLYCKKNGYEYNFDFNLVDISTSLENKNLNENSLKMIDFGLPLDMVKKINVKGSEKLDEYEKTILKEYNDIL